MARKKRMFFERNVNAYREFLTKFIEKPSFDESSITIALKHAFTKSSHKLQPTTLKRLINVVFVKQEKILTDIEIIKISPKSPLEPLVSRISPQVLQEIFDRKKRNICKKRRNDENLINRNCKKIKFSFASKNQDGKSTSKECDNINKRTLFNRNPYEYFKLEKRKSIPCVNKIKKDPLVVLENNKKLCDVASNLFVKNKNEKKERNNDNESEKSVDDSNTITDSVCISNDHGEKEDKNEEPINNVQNDDLEVIQDNENRNFEYICIKQEKDLLDRDSQFNASQTETCESQTTCSEDNDNFQSEIHDEFSNSSLNSDIPAAIYYWGQTIGENSLPMINPYYNNLTAMYNNINSIKNTSFMFNMNNTNPCIPVQMQQYNPNIIMINPYGLQTYQGMYNHVLFNPLSTNTLTMPSDFGMLSQPQPQLLSESCDSSQDFNSLQTAIANIDSQLTSLKNALATVQPCFINTT